ncbi:MAG: amidase [Smithellaceae bacterium]|nr:amidase [Smithellaceae bacterium]
MKRELYKLGLVEVWQGINNGLFTAEDYTRALLARISAQDETIGAWAWLDEERAISAARRSDKMINKGRSPASLRGIPVGVKDIFASKGIPTEMGSPAFAGHVPGESAAVIKRLESRGGFVLGKTVTTECAFLSPSKTRNPWNPLHTPGGSSSGSAAAVAAGFAPAAVGSQTNGSTIRPAAFCGVVGFKPSQGLIPIAGALTFSHTLDQVGLFTRKVADAAWLAHALISGPMRPPQGVSPLPAPPRLAAVKTPVWDLAEDYAKGHFINMISEIKKAGAQVTEVELPEIFNHAHQALRFIMLSEAACNMEELRLCKGDRLSGLLKNFLAEGREVTAVVYLQALRLRQLMQGELWRFLSDFDAIITPPTTGEAPATLDQTGNPGFCSIWNLCGVPALTIPVGLGPRGLPLGLQITAAHGKDHLALSVGRWLEAVFPFDPLSSRK